MRFWFGIIVIGMSGFVCVGCDRQQRDATVPSYIAEHVETIRRTLKYEGNRIDLNKTAESTMNMFCSISNKLQRIRAVKTYSDMLLAIDLKDLPCQTREWATSQYGSSVCHCFRIMRKCEVAPAESIDWFFTCLAKFKDLCQSISTVERLPGETMSESRLRHHYLRLYRSDYEYLISILRRFWIPQLSLYLPEEYHSEFVRRLNFLEGEILTRKTTDEALENNQTQTHVNERPPRIMSPVVKRP